MNIEKEDRDRILIIAIIFVIAIFCYLVSLGQFDVLKNTTDLSIEERKKLAADRHKKLVDLIERKKGLKRKLDKKFRLAYLAVRIIFIALWGSINAVAYFMFKLQDFGALLTFNEIVIIVVVVMNFLSFGTFTSLKSIVTYFKNRLEIKVYNKYLNIGEQILNHENEKNELLYIMKEN